MVTMIDIFNTLESTINKNTIKQLNDYLDNYKDVEKWIICSDYCLYDKQKPNNVITFVLFPHIVDIAKVTKYIDSIQPSDLKHSRRVTKEFIDLIDEGYVYSFNFILEKNNLFDKLVNQDSLPKILREMQDVFKKWEISTPGSKDRYHKNSQILGELINKCTKRSNVNLKLYRSFISTTFLAAYVSLLLVRHHKIKLLSWLSDVDKITQSFDGIYYEIFDMILHNLCNELCPDNYKDMVIVQPQIVDNKIIFDQFNRIADYFCGALADYSLKKNINSKSKHNIIISQLFANTKYISVVLIHDNGIAMVDFKRREFPITNNDLSNLRSMIQTCIANMRHESDEIKSFSRINRTYDSDLHKKNNFDRRLFFHLTKYFSEHEENKYIVERNYKHVKNFFLLNTVTEETVDIAIHSKQIELYTVDNYLIIETVNYGENKGNQNVVKKYISNSYYNYMFGIELTYDNLVSVRAHVYYIENNEIKTVQWNF